MAQITHSPPDASDLDALCRIQISIEEVEAALSFAKDIHRRQGQSRRDFGRVDLVRSKQDFRADTFEGKLAEIALSKFLHQAKAWGFTPDFEIYENPLWIDHGQDLIRLEIDGQIKQIRSRIDIKATRMSSQWLLVESHKFWSDAYILVKLDLPHDIETKEFDFSTQNVQAEILGFAYFFDIVDMDCFEPRFEFSKGSRLLSTGSLCQLDIGITSSVHEIREARASYASRMCISEIGPYLKAELNYGLPINWLRRSPAEWESFFRWIQSSALSAKS